MPRTDKKSLQMGETVTLERELIVRLRAIREQAKISQENLGRLVGYSKNGISLFERGENHPRMDQFAAMAKALGYHLHVALRAGADDPLNEVERAAMALPVDRIKDAIRFLRVLPRANIRVVRATLAAWEEMHPAEEREATDEQAII